MFSLHFAIRLFYSEPNSFLASKRNGTYPLSNICRVSFTSDQRFYSIKTFGSFARSSSHRWSSNSSLSRELIGGCVCDLVVFALLHGLADAFHCLLKLLLAF